MKAIFRESKKSYGSRRIVVDLQTKGFDIGRYRVRSLMKKLGLKVKSAKRYKVTTNSRHNYPVAPNLLNRQFDVKAPNKVWTTDCGGPQKPDNMLSSESPKQKRS